MKLRVWLFVGLVCFVGCVGAFTGAYIILDNPGVGVERIKIAPGGAITYRDLRDIVHNRFGIPIDNISLTNKDTLELWDRNDLENTEVIEDVRPRSVLEFVVEDIPLDEDVSTSVEDGPVLSWWEELD